MSQCSSPVAVALESSSLEICLPFWRTFWNCSDWGKEAAERRWRLILRPRRGWWISNEWEFKSVYALACDSLKINKACITLAATPPPETHQCKKSSTIVSLTKSGFNFGKKFDLNMYGDIPLAKQSPVLWAKQIRDQFSPPRKEAEEKEASNWIEIRSKWNKWLQKKGTEFSPLKPFTILFVWCYRVWEETHQLAQAQAPKCITNLTWGEDQNTV